MNASPSMRWWTPMTVAVGLALAAVLVVVAAIAAAGSGDATSAVPEIESPGATDDPDGAAPSDDEPAGPADSDEPTGDSSDPGAAPELDTGADERGPLVIHHVGDVNLDRGQLSAVFGHHAHRLQPLERADGVPVFWNLGNFVWPNRSEDASRTAVAEFTIEPDGTTQACLLPFRIDEGGVPRPTGDASVCG